MSAPLFNFRLILSQAQMTEAEASKQDSSTERMFGIIKLGFPSRTLEQNLNRIKRCFGKANNKTSPEKHKQDKASLVDRAFRNSKSQRQRGTRKN